MRESCSVIQHNILEIPIQRTISTDLVISYLRFFDLNTGMNSRIRLFIIYYFENS